MSNRISNEELANLIKTWESISFECKETLNRELKEKLSTYFAAFANTEGGLFVFGINNSKEMVGYTLEKGEREYISQQAENCNPPVNIDIEEARQYDNNKIVLIYIPKSNTIHTDKHHRFPIRVGSNIHHLNIEGLIPLAKERLGLIYGTEGLKFPAAGFLGGAEEMGTEATPEEIELCLNAIEGTNKDARLQGLRELELQSYTKEMFNDLRILDALEELLQNEEPEIRKKVLFVLFLFLFRARDNGELRQKLIDRYSKHIINISRADLNLEVRSEAIRTSVAMDDQNLIEIIVDITKYESDEVFGKIKAYCGLRNLGYKNKLEIKKKLIDELENSKNTQNINQRIIDVLEIIRTPSGW